MYLYVLSFRTEAAQLIRKAKAYSNSYILTIIYSSTQKDFQEVPGSCIQTSQSWLCTNAQGYKVMLPIKLCCHILIEEKMGKPKT